MLPLELKRQVVQNCDQEALWRLCQCSKLWHHLVMPTLFYAPILKTRQQWELFIAAICSSPSRSDLVRVLDLSELTPRWDFIGNGEVVQLARCENLKHLNLEFCKNVQNSCLTSLALHNFEELSLSECVNLTDHGLEQIMSSISTAKVGYFGYQDHRLDLDLSVAELPKAARAEHLRL
ncbi:MAG: hypothetical protein SGCHY_000260 [Lobulomycetales sp.]